MCHHYLTELFAPMKLKILQVGNPVLREAAKELSPDEIHTLPVQQLIAYMTETLRDAPGVGLAAPQVGESLQIAVVEDRAEYLQHWRDDELKARERRPVPLQVLINPKITAASSECIGFHEGCLSMAGFMGVVPRSVNVTVSCLDATGQPKVIEASGWFARILQHEIDHLQGTLCIDKMQLPTLATVENFQRYGRRGH